MPSSFVDSIPPIVKVLAGRSYSSILDIGPGWGKYGLLVSTPKQFIHQHDDENQYETHVSLWNWDSLRRHRIIEDVSTIDSLIYLLGPS